MNGVLLFSAANLLGLVVLGYHGAQSQTAAQAAQESIVEQQAKLAASILRLEVEMPQIRGGAASATVVQQAQQAAAQQAQQRQATQAQAAHAQGPPSNAGTVHIPTQTNVSAPRPQAVVEMPAKAPGLKPLPQEVQWLDTSADFGPFLEQIYAGGAGVVLGVGPSGDFAFDLLGQWQHSPGLYLVDPFIHIWQGYDSPEFNLSDRDHQLLFEQLRNKLHTCAHCQNRHALVRDFAHSFAVTFKDEPAQKALVFVWFDTIPTGNQLNRDLDSWWPLIQQSGIAAGTRWDAVGPAVRAFANAKGIDVHVMKDGSWAMFKQ